MLHVEIRIKGRIASHWSGWFEGLTITYTENDETILTGEVLDQSALFGPQQPWSYAIPDNSARVPVALHKIDIALLDRLAVQ